MTPVTPTSFLDAPQPTMAGEAIFDDDVAELGYVMNATRLWAYQPDTFTGLFDLMAACTKAGGLTLRDRGILVTACASTMGDSYCSLSWGAKLAATADAATAASVLRGGDDRLTPAEQGLAQWARRIAHDPNATTSAHVEELRGAGYMDARIFAITVYVALRIAFSTVNDALGALPDAALRASAPAEVVDTVTYGRPFDDCPRRHAEDIT